MKKIIMLLCGLLAICIDNVYGQLTLTPDGLTIDDGGDYIVLDFSDKSKEQLFDNAHLFAGSNFVSPQDVISVSGKEQITLNGVVSNIEWKNIMVQHCSVNFTITMLFKDGKIRINIPTINSIHTSGAELYIVQSTVLLTDGIFKKNGKLYSAKTKSGIEDFFNGFIKDLKEYIDQNKSEDW